MELVLWVEGTPVTQGSKNAYVRGGRAVLVEHAGPRLTTWRTQIQVTAEAEARNQLWLATGRPVKVRVEFLLARARTAPKYRTQPTSARDGDLDKLTRAALDSLTAAGIWGDDKQVTELHARKSYAPTGTPTGALIRIETQEETP